MKAATSSGSRSAWQPTSRAMPMPGKSLIGASSVICREGQPTMAKPHVRLLVLLATGVIALTSETAASPLDKFDASTIPALEKFPWHPRELVAILGEHKGRQGGPVTSVAQSRNGK